MTLQKRLNGRKMDVNYETGYHFQIEFLDEHTLRWHALAKVAEGAPSEEDEPYSVKEISEGVYFLNWIEGSGLVVSQIDDFNQGKVFAYMTWPDSNGRGHRAFLLHQGTLSIVE